MRKKSIGVEYKRGGVSMSSLTEKHLVSIRSVKTVVKLTPQLVNIDPNASILNKFNKNTIIHEKYVLIYEYIMKYIKNKGQVVEL